MPASPFQVTIALSGLSSTGKSTIASYLPSIFPPPSYTLTVLHIDDFYQPETDLPLRDGLKDWDCANSLDWPRLEAAVRAWIEGKEVKEGTTNPQPDFTAREHPSGDLEEDRHDAQTLLPGKISADLVPRLRGEVLASTTRKNGGNDPHRLLVLDGFLLFVPSAPASFRSLLDLKILLRAPYAAAKERREARCGYVTMEGWWEDPPGYFDKVVWPNYVEENGIFFVDGDVEAEVDEKRCAREGVSVCPVMCEDGLGGVLRWVVGEMLRYVSLWHEG